jgi:hypothetical protein
LGRQHISLFLYVFLPDAVFAGRFAFPILCRAENTFSPSSAASKNIAANQKECPHCCLNDGILVLHCL